MDNAAIRRLCSAVKASRLQMTILQSTPKIFVTGKSLAQSGAASFIKFDQFGGTLSHEQSASIPCAFSWSELHFIAVAKNLFSYDRQGYAILLFSDLLLQWVACRWVQAKQGWVGQPLVYWKFCFLNCEGEGSVVVARVGWCCFLLLLWWWWWTVAMVVATWEAKGRWVASLASCRGQPLGLAPPLPHASWYCYHTHTTARCAAMSTFGTHKNSHSLHYNNRLRWSMGFEKY